MQGTSDYAKIIPLADTWRSITFPIFPQTYIMLCMTYYLSRFCHCYFDEKFSRMMTGVCHINMTYLIGIIKLFNYFN